MLKLAFGTFVICPGILQRFNTSVDWFLPSYMPSVPENVYSIYYPTVARRIVEKKVKLNVPNTSDGMQTLIFKPLDPGIVLEKLVVDYGGYKKSYLFMNESKSKRDNR